MSWKWLLMHNNMLQFAVLFAALLSVYLDIVDVDCPVVLLTKSIMTAFFNSDVHEWRKKYAFTMCIWLLVFDKCPEI